MASSQSIFATLPPITCGALTTATTMYPVDLLRALKMSAAAEGVSKGTGELVKEFHAKHGLKGFVSQGVLPEMLRATYMRVLKFFLFPITHKAVFGMPENKGSAMTKAVAGGLASLPEGFTIQVCLPPAGSPDTVKTHLTDHFRFTFLHMHPHKSTKYLPSTRWEILDRTRPQFFRRRHARPWHTRAPPCL